MQTRARDTEPLLFWEALSTPRSQCLFIHNLLPRIDLSSLQPTGGGLALRSLRPASLLIIVLFLSTHRLPGTEKSA